MATFLATRKMSAELIARVEDSVRGRRASAGTSRRPRAAFWIRLVVLATIVGLFSWVAVVRNHAHQQLEQSRAGLLRNVRRASASLAEQEKNQVLRLSSWLEQSSGDDALDSVAEGLGQPGALATVLARPMVYVRGPLATFKNSAGIRESASLSLKDAFLLCLVDPPSSRGENAMLSKVRAAYSDGQRLRGSTRHVERLHAALSGLPLLAPAWERRVLLAERTELVRLTRDFERAPIDSAERAAKAGLLLFAMDEAPENAMEPAELDGERARFVRVGLVDLGSSRYLLRLRRRVDPSWISVALRAEYAKGMNGCALALDTHEAVRLTRAEASR